MILKHQRQKTSKRNTDQCHLHREIHHRNNIDVLVTLLSLLVFSIWIIELIIESKTSKLNMSGLFTLHLGYDGCC